MSLIPAGQPADNDGFRFVHLSYATFLVTPIAVEFCPKVVNLAVLYPGPLASQGSFTHLLYLNTGRVATDKTNQLPFGGMVKWFRDKLDDYPMVLCLAQDHSEMDRITAQSIDGIGHKMCYIALADSLA